MQRLHADAQPGRFIANPDQVALTRFFEKALADGGTLLLARDAGGTVIGYLLWTITERVENAFRHAEREGLLDQICVAPAARRQGIAQALIAVMKDQMRAAGLERWAVTYWNFNSASAALMESAGVRPGHIRAEGHLSDS